MRRDELFEDIERLEEAVFYYEKALVEIERLQVTPEMFTKDYLDTPPAELSDEEILAEAIRDGVERCLSNVSEALNHLSSETVYALGIEDSAIWRDLRGYRNHSDHEYPQLDFNLAWDLLMAVESCIHEAQARLHTLYEIRDLGEYDRA